MILDYSGLISKEMIRGHLWLLFSTKGIKIMATCFGLF